MIYLNAVILAIVEGVTEFIPISSTGHLILAEQFVSLGDEGAFAENFIVIIQLPAILSVVVYFWKDLWPFSKPHAERFHTLMLWSKIIVAVLPAVILGLLFNDYIEALLGNPIAVGITLFLGGVILIAVEMRRPTPKVHHVYDITYWRALQIGVFQCIAMIPGVSRSGATIVGAMLLGTGRAAAAEFSFFLAIPTMLGATTLTMLKANLDYTAQEWTLLAIGSAVSFVTAYAVIALFMSYIRRHTFIPFGWYRIALGIIVVAYFMTAA